MAAPMRSRVLRLSLVDKNGLWIRAQEQRCVLSGSFRSVHTSSVVNETEDKKQQRKFTTINKETAYNLCFLRHGQSTWNRDNRFIGWHDTPLTDDGVLEARVAGQMLSNSGILFDEVHTSLLRRCIRTVNLTLMEMQQEWIPVHKHWRLNERVSNSSSFCDSRMSASSSSLQFISFCCGYVSFRHTES